MDQNLLDSMKPVSFGNMPIIKVTNETVGESNEEVGVTVNKDLVIPSEADPDEERSPVSEAEEEKATPFETKQDLNVLELPNDIVQGQDEPTPNHSEIFKSTVKGSDDGQNQLGANDSFAVGADPFGGNGSAVNEPVEED
jgi:hypothetical protein